MITIPYTNPNICYVGRFLTPDGGMQSAWQASQIRLKVSGTTQVIFVADIKDIGNDSACFVGVSIDNSPEEATLFYLSTLAEIVEEERTVTIALPDTNEHLLTLKTSSNFPHNQYAMTSYINFKSIQIDDGGAIVAYAQSGKLLMCLGDSWMAVSHDWPRLMDKYALYPVALGGAKASDIDAMYPYQASGVAKDDPIVDGAIICLGVNDHLALVSTSDYKASIQSLVNKIQADQTCPIFLIQAPRNIGAGETYDEYGAVLNEIACLETNVYYISTSSIWSIMTWTDTYHLDSTGKRVFANYIEDQLDAVFYDFELKYRLNGITHVIKLYDPGAMTGYVLKVNYGGNVKCAQLLDYPAVLGSDLRVRVSTGSKAVAVS